MNSKQEIYRQSCSESNYSLTTKFSYAPTLSRPSNCLLEATQPQYLTWRIKDKTTSNPKYTICLNGSIWNTLQDKSFTVPDDTISISLATLNPGNYNVSILVEDGTGNNTQNDVQVQVYNKLPVLTPVQDVQITVNSTTNATNLTSYANMTTPSASGPYSTELAKYSLVWEVIDGSVKGPIYQIYRNGTKLVEKNWTRTLNSNKSTIEINLGDCEIGIYNYTLILEDGFGGITQDAVELDILLILIEDILPNIDLGISGFPLSIMFLLGIGACFLLKRSQRNRINRN